MLILEGISKSYQQRGAVLSNLDLEVKRGDTIAITGPSGSGKTTLLNIIGLLDRPDTGNMHFNGKNVTGYDHEEAARYRNRNIGFVFQDHLLLPYLTIIDNIMLPALASGHTDTEMVEIRKHAADMMLRTGIQSLSGKYPFQVSGGEAQRAAIVRALVNSPSLLLADEPTGALDAANGQMLSELLLELNREAGVAMIIATHSAELASKMSTGMKLTDGRLIPS